MRCSLANRRGTSRAAIELKLQEHDDHEETNQRRLVRLGRSEEEAKVLLKEEGGGPGRDGLWLALSGLVAVFVVVVVGVGLGSALGRKRARGKRAEQKARERF